MAPSKRGFKTPDISNLLKANTRPPTLDNSNANRGEASSSAATSSDQPPHNVQKTGQPIQQPLEEDYEVDETGAESTSAGPSLSKNAIKQAAKRARQKLQRLQQKNESEQEREQDRAVKLDLQTSPYLIARRRKSKVSKVSAHHVANQPSVSTGPGPFEGLPADVISLVRIRPYSQPYPPRLTFTS